MEIQRWLYNCSNSLDFCDFSKFWKWKLAFLWGFQNHIFVNCGSGIALVLLVVVLISTFGLLLKVHKTRGLRKQGVFSIILVSSVFFICYTPMFISHVLQAINRKGMAHLDISRIIVSNIYYISCFSNPLIYYLTLNSFKKYVDDICRKYLTCFACHTSAE